MKNYLTHYVTSEQQAADNGVSACGSAHWEAGTTDLDAVTCLLCLRGEIERLGKFLLEMTATANAKTRQSDENA